MDFKKVEKNHLNWHRHSERGWVEHCSMPAKGQLKPRPDTYTGTVQDWQALTSRQRYNITHAVRVAAAAKAYSTTRAANRLKNIVHHAAKQKVYYDANKKVINAKQKVYRIANNEAITAQKKMYYEVNKKDIIAKQSVYYDANKEAYLATHKVHRDANKDDINYKQRVYYHANSDTIMEQQRAYKLEKEKTFYEMWGEDGIQP